MNEANLCEKLKKIKLLAMDVDGTMTNSTVYYSKNGEELKRFCIRDGMGIELLRREGIKTAIITSENSPIVTARANKLRIEHLFFGSRNKKRDIEQLAAQLEIGVDEIAFFGVDVNDLQAIQTAGIGACPSDANESIKENADYICDAKGGEGAIREIIEKILLSQKKSISLPESW